MNFPSDPLGQFVAASSALTGYTEVELTSVGVANEYWGQLLAVAGPRIAGQLLTAFAHKFEKAKSREELEHEIADILDSKIFGPLVQNIISMWYLSTWQQLPAQWRDSFGAAANDFTQIISKSAYRGGLIWPTFGAHPTGAKPTGYGSWSEPPAMYRHG